MYLSEKHDGCAPARTRQAPSRPLLSTELTTLEKRHRLHVLTVVPISNRSAYGLYGYMGIWTGKMSKREMLRQYMPLTHTKDHNRLPKNP